MNIYKIKTMKGQEFFVVAKNFLQALRAVPEKVCTPACGGLLSLKLYASEHVVVLAGED